MSVKKQMYPIHAFSQDFFETSQSPVFYSITRSLHFTVYTLQCCDRLLVPMLWWDDSGHVSYSASKYLNTGHRMATVGNFLAERLFSVANVVKYTCSHIKRLLQCSISLVTGIGVTSL